MVLGVSIQLSQVRHFRGFRTKNVRHPRIFLLQIVLLKMPEIFKLPQYSQMQEKRIFSHSLLLHKKARISSSFNSVFTVFQIVCIIEDGQLTVINTIVSDIKRLKNFYYYIHFISIYSTFYFLCVLFFSFRCKTN